MRTRSRAKSKEVQEVVKADIRPPIWQSVGKVDIPMSLNVSSRRKSRRISDVKNRDIYDIELSLSPKKEDAIKKKIRKAPKIKRKNIPKCSFKKTTLTTDKLWKNPLTIPTSQFYRKTNDTTVDNSELDHSSDHEDFTNDDMGYDASVSVVTNDEESCFSLPSVSTLIPNIPSKQNDFFKGTSTPYGGRTYSKPIKLTKEEELQMCFGFEEPENDLLLSPVEKHRNLTSVQLSSYCDADTDQGPCPTRMTAQLPAKRHMSLTYHDVTKKFKDENKPKKVKKISSKSSVVNKYMRHKVRQKKSVPSRKPLSEIQATRKEEIKNKSILEDWASDVNSHFSEIDEMELCVD